MGWRQLEQQAGKRHPRQPLALQAPCHHHHGTSKRIPHGLPGAYALASCLLLQIIIGTNSS